MKKTILIALMAIVATGAVIAQDTNEKKERRGRDGEKQIERQMKRLDKKLSLTEDQKMKLKDYYTEFQNMKKARMEQMRQQEQRDREALDNKINSILTDEQKAKYAEMKDKNKDMWKDGNHDQMRGKGHGPRHGGKGHMRGAHKGHDRFGDNVARDMEE
ncbi:MAG: hypothetical protein II445_10640 [Muribaculaceae bacterium]|nr:hypothetical protein [Muribaculaceae bacterium]